MSYQEKIGFNKKRGSHNSPFFISERLKMAAPNEQQMDEIIELTEIVEEGSPQEQTDKKDPENVDGFPKENAVESKDFDEELTDILESVIDDDPESEKEPEKDTLEDLSFDDLFEEDILSKDDLSSEKRSSEEENLTHDDAIVQSSATTEETEDEFAELDNIIADLDEDNPDQALEEASVEDEIISDLEKSIQDTESEKKKEARDETSLKSESQDTDEIAIQQNKLINLEQRLDNLEAGLEDKLAQIKIELLNEINDQMDNQVKLQVTEILTSELEPLKQKIAQVEEQLNNLSIPGKDELKEAISQEITRTLDENKEDSTKQKELQKYIFEVIEQQLEAKISTWQKEKEALTRKIEEASKYQAKLQDSLEKLASDIGEIKDRTSTEKLNQQVEELSLNFVSKDELKLLASQLKIELEEFITKQVPLAAAQVIREEISALLKEKR
jgi:hypothetical protein